MASLCSPALVVCALFAIVRARDLDFGVETLSTESAASQEARLCLSRVAPLPKDEGYGALCTSIETLYQQQQTNAASFMAIKEQGERLHASNADLEQKNRELEAQNKNLEAENNELQTHKISREKEWQSAAKKFQAEATEWRTTRDAGWQATVSRLEARAAKKLQTTVASRDARWQAIITEKLRATVASRDARWKAIIGRLEGENKELEKQTEDLRQGKQLFINAIGVTGANKDKELQKQKEATVASTSSRRSILLALTRAKQKSQTESREVRLLTEQIKALQKENAQLVQQCVVGNT